MRLSREIHKNNLPTKLITSLERQITSYVTVFKPFHWSVVIVRRILISIEN